MSASLSSVLLLILLLLFPLRASSIFLQLNIGEWINLLSTVSSAGQHRPRLVGPGRAHSKKNPFKKIYDFPTYFSINFLLNISLYFYNVKIQIRYQNTQFSLECCKKKNYKTKKVLFSCIWSSL
jgi:hypothetical protein